MKSDAWFRVYTRIVDNPKLQQLPPELFRQLVNYWALAKLNGGVLPSIDEIAWRLRRPSSQVREEIDALLSEPYCLLEVKAKKLRPTMFEQWQTRSSSSTERMRIKRERDRVVTPNVTEIVTPDVTRCDGESDGSDARERDGDVTKNVTRTRTRTRKESPLPPLSAFDFESRFAELWQAYPAKGRTRQPMCEQIYVGILDPLSDESRDSTHRQMLEPLLPGGKWIISDSWAKGFVFSLADYLTQRRWSESPVPAAGNASAETECW